VRRRWCLSNLAISIGVADRNLDGNGPGQDSQAGAATVRVTLTHGGSSLAGTWSFIASAQTHSGSLSGSVPRSSQRS